MILITGLTGTSGSAFVDVLSREKFSEPLRVVVRETSNIQKLENSGLNYELAYGSIDDEEFLAKVAGGCDTVFHIAAKAKLGNIARSVVQTVSVKQCIIVSSTSIYSKYSAASNKIISAEKEMKKLFAEKGISWVLIRPTMIFGTLNDHNISTFMRWLDKYPLFPIVKNGQALLQPVNKCDIAEAYYLILINRANISHKEYIISGEKAMTLKRTLEEIARSIGKKNGFINVPFLLAGFGAKCLYIISLKKIDIREKLFRLTENRAFGHTEITTELGYNPRPFEYWIKQLATEYLDTKGKRS